MADQRLAVAQPCDCVFQPHALCKFFVTDWPFSCAEPRLKFQSQYSLLSFYNEEWQHFRQCVSCETSARSPDKDSSSLIRSLATTCNAWPCEKGLQDVQGLLMHLCNGKRDSHASISLSNGDTTFPVEESCCPYDPLLSGVSIWKHASGSGIPIRCRIFKCKPPVAAHPKVMHATKPVTYRWLPVMRAESLFFGHRVIVAH